VIYTLEVKRRKEDSKLTAATESESLSVYPSKESPLCCMHDVCEIGIEIRRDGFNEEMRHKQDSKANKLFLVSCNFQIYLFTSNCNQQGRLLLIYIWDTLKSDSFHIILTSRLSSKLIYFINKKKLSWVWVWLIDLFVTAAVLNFISLEIFFCCLCNFNTKNVFNFYRALSWLSLKSCEWCFVGLTESTLSQVFDVVGACFAQRVFHVCRHWCLS
jgi:hypothetical protein